MAVAPVSFGRARRQGFGPAPARRRPSSCTCILGSWHDPDGGVSILVDDLEGVVKSFDQAFATVVPRPDGVETNNIRRRPALPFAGVFQQLHFRYRCGDAADRVCGGVYAKRIRFWPRNRVCCSWRR